jgi:hypothetical protein
MSHGFAALEFVLGRDGLRSVAAPSSHGFGVKAME